jgi:integrase
MLDPYLGQLALSRINGDVIWNVTQAELRRGNAPGTVNRYLATIRNVLRIARDEWQWVDSVPKIRLLAGEVQRDRWVTREEAQRLIAACRPHLAALVKFALATGRRAREITGLEWNRVDAARKTAWLDRTKNGTPRGVPLNSDAIAVLEAECGTHRSKYPPQDCGITRCQDVPSANAPWTRTAVLAGPGAGSCADAVNETSKDLDTMTTEVMR